VPPGNSAAGICSADINDGYQTHGIGLNALASTPFNVAVGGTDFSDTDWRTSIYWNSGNTPTYGSVKSYIPETPRKRLLCQ